MTVFLEYDRLLDTGGCTIQRVVGAVTNHLDWLFDGEPVLHNILTISLRAYLLL